MPIDLRAAAAGAEVMRFVSPPITRENLAAYAEASGDLNPLHLDPAFARKAGFDDVIVHGMLSMGILARMLTDHVEAERITNLSARFVGTVAVNESLHCTARLEALEPEAALLSLEAATSSGSVAVVATARVGLA